jgi:sulfite exporter TauE/SafE
MAWTKSDSNFYLLWGNLLTAIGALLTVNTLVAGIAVIIFVVFLIWMAVFALLFASRRKSA